MKRVWVVGLLTVGILATSVWSFTAAPQSAIAETLSVSSVAAAAEEAAKVTLWEPLVSPKYAWYEKVALITNVFIALAGLGYALMLVKQVRRPTRAPSGCRRSPRRCGKAPTPTCTGSSAWSAY